MLHARPYSRRLAPPPDPALRLLIVRLLRWWDSRANPKSRVRLSQQCWFAFCAAMMRDVRALSNRCCERFLSGERRLPACWLRLLAETLCRRIVGKLPTIAG